MDRPLKVFMKKGDRFGRLEFVREIDKQGGRRRILCRCDCGNSKEFDFFNVRSGKTMSCGCIHSLTTSVVSRTHGKSKDPIYIVWRNMLVRCDAKNAESNPTYAGRGISVCEEWKSFDAFYRDMGDIPSKGMQIERVDNDGDYCKENCCWATTTQQARNKTTSRIVEFNGVSKSLAEHCEDQGIGYKKAFRRLSLGWSVEKTFTTP